MPEGRDSLVKRIAAERMEILFGLAEGVAARDGALARRYVSELRKISSHYKVRMPKGMRNRICTACNAPLVPGFNSTVRLSSANRYVVYRCDACRRERHVHY